MLAPYVQTYTTYIHFNSLYWEGQDRICAIFAGQVKSEEIGLYLTVDMKKIIFESYFVKFVAILSMRLVEEDWRGPFISPFHNLIETSQPEFHNLTML